MANDYQKIDTLFMRDEKNIIIPTQMIRPEFDYLKDCLWECTEKVDGVNIHIDITFTVDSIEEGLPKVRMDIAIYGRTESAKIPDRLYKKLQEMVNRETECGSVIAEAFSSVITKLVEKGSGTTTVSIYGEGYGFKIQKGGNYIKDDVDFILFDVKVGDWWLKREDCEEIAGVLGVAIVPLIGYMTIPQAIEYVRRGFKSRIAENPDYDAEGLVLKTPYGLKFRNGQRIITKIKTRDFQKYRNKYGDGPVDQMPNPKYQVRTDS